MDPDQFREIRLKINRINEDININLEKNDVPAAKKNLNHADTLLEDLAGKADGKIQLRSVKNLGYKLKSSSTLIDKVKPAKTTSKKSGPSEKIIWDEDKLSLLSANYLKKLVDNMKSNMESMVSFSTTGKGLTPSYQIDFGKDGVSSFSGSRHLPLKRNLPQNQDRISKPFPFSTIQTILNNKQ